jgi:hypothetical protein
MSWSRFGSRLCLLETTVKLLLGVLPHARPGERRLKPGTRRMQGRE